MVAIGRLDFLAYMTTRMVSCKAAVKRYLEDLPLRAKRELRCDSEVRSRVFQEDFSARILEP